MGLVWAAGIQVVQAAQPVESGQAIVDSFAITDVRLQGLQRVSAGTVFNLIPVAVGDQIDQFGVRNLMRDLFASGLF